MFFCMVFALTQSIGQPVDVPTVVEQALDEKMVDSLEFSETPIPTVAQMISEKTGVEVRLTVEAMNLLPYGQETTLNAVLKDIPLREALKRLLGHLGMTYRVEGRGITVIPSEALDRIGRRVTWAELETLGWLTEVRWRQQPEELEKLRQKLQFKVNADQPWDDLRAAIERTGSGVGGDVLTQACNSLGWSWYASHEEIVILSRTDEIQRRLGRGVNVRANGRPLWEVLQEVAGQVGVVIREEPGTFAGLPAQFRDRFTLIADAGQAEQVLQSVAASTGLGYRVQADGVVFFSPAVGSFAPITTGSAPAVVPLRIVVRTPEQGGFEFQLRLQETDLSPEVRSMLEKLIRESGGVLEAEIKPVAPARVRDR